MKMKLNLPKKPKHQRGSLQKQRNQNKYKELISWQDWESLMPSMLWFQWKSLSLTKCWWMKLSRRRLTNSLGKLMTPAQNSWIFSLKQSSTTMVTVCIMRCLRILEASSSSTLGRRLKQRHKQLSKISKIWLRLSIQTLWRRVSEPQPSRKHWAEFTIKMLKSKNQRMNLKMRSLGVSPLFSIRKMSLWISGQSNHRQSRCARSTTHTKDKLTRPTSC